MRTFDKPKFTELYTDANTSIDEIARQFGLSRTGVYRRAEYLSLPKIRSANQPKSAINSEKYLNNTIPSYDTLMNMVKSQSEILNPFMYTPFVMSNEITTDVPIALTFTADWHLGEGTDWNAFDADINTIRDTDGLFAYAGGDLKENIMQPSKMGSSFTQDRLVVQNALMFRTLEKIQSKIVALGSGNHDWEKLLTGADTVASLARSLKVVYTDVGGLFKLKVGNQEYKIFRTHKYRFNSSLNLCHTAKQCWRFGEFDADIVVVEHQHQAAVEPFNGHGVERIAVRTGTYKIYDDYARKHGFYSLKVNNPTVILFPDKRKIIPFLHMDEALICLNALR